MKVNVYLLAIIQIKRNTDVFIFTGLTAYPNKPIQLQKQLRSYILFNLLT